MQAPLRCGHAPKAIERVRYTEFITQLPLYRKRLLVHGGCLLQIAQRVEDDPPATSSSQRRVPRYLARAQWPGTAGGSSPLDRKGYIRD